MSNWLWLFCRSGFIFIMEEEFTCGIRIIAGFFSLSDSTGDRSDWYFPVLLWIIFVPLLNASNDTIYYKINFENFDT